MPHLVCAEDALVDGYDLLFCKIVHRSALVKQEPSRSFFSRHPARRDRTHRAVERWPTLVASFGKTTVSAHLHEINYPAVLFGTSARRLWF